MNMLHRGALAFALLSAPHAARADATDYSVTSSAWTQVGSAGTSVWLQAIGNSVILSTSTASPSTLEGVQLLATTRACRVLTQNLWARGVNSGATIKTNTGVTC